MTLRICCAQLWMIDWSSPFFRAFSAGLSQNFLSCAPFWRMKGQQFARCLKCVGVARVTGLRRLLVILMALTQVRVLHVFADH